jgi:hypothetical protein
MAHTTPLEERSDKELHQMLDEGVVARGLRRARRLRRARIILRRRVQSRRQWLFTFTVAGFIVAVIALLMAIN